MYANVMDALYRSVLGCGAWILVAALATAQQPAPSEVQLDRCLISLIAEAEVPAQEAGVVVEMSVREGQSVESGALLARIDDVSPQLQK